MHRYILFLHTPHQLGLDSRHSYLQRAHLSAKARGFVILLYLGARVRSCTVSFLFYETGACECKENCMTVPYVMSYAARAQCELNAS